MSGYPYSQSWHTEPSRNPSLFYENKRIKIGDGVFAAGNHGPDGREAVVASRIEEVEINGGFFFAGVSGDDAAKMMGAQRVPFASNQYAGGQRGPDGQHYDNYRGHNPSPNWAPPRDPWPPTPNDRRYQGEPRYRDDTRYQYRGDYCPPRERYETDSSYYRGPAPNAWNRQHDERYGYEMPRPHLDPRGDPQRGFESKRYQDARTATHEHPSESEDDEIYITDHMADATISDRPNPLLQSQSAPIVPTNSTFPSTVANNTQKIDFPNTPPYSVVEPPPSPAAEGFPSDVQSQNTAYSGQQLGVDGMSSYKPPLPHAQTMTGRISAKFKSAKVKK